MITAGSNGRIANNIDAAAFQFQYSCNKGILLCDLRAAEGSLSVVPYFSARWTLSGTFPGIVGLGNLLLGTISKFDND